jgi:uncharacterized protein YbjT (DUF2867 family)
MSNWDGMLDGVRATGKLPTMFPADMPIPMVAPKDLGRIAADRLMSGREDTGIRYVEGPRRYSSAEVAQAFSSALGRPVTVEVTPRERWKQAFQAMGFSDAAAESYAGMTAASVDSDFEVPEEPLRGTTTLETYIRDLVSGNGRVV